MSSRSKISDDGPFEIAGYLLFRWRSIAGWGQWRATRGKGVVVTYSPEFQIGSKAEQDHRQDIEKFLHNLRRHNRD